MLKANSISKSFGSETVFRNISFVLNTGERIGLVGPNGSGKSTLLRVLAGELAPDQGSVGIGVGHRTAYMPQYPLDELRLSVEEALLRGARDAGCARQSLSQLEAELATATGVTLDGLLAAYSEAQATFERLGGYELEARMAEVIAGLSLQVFDLGASVASLSGGNKTKLSLARLLLSDATILMLDEPTNYLDLPALVWLERFIVEGNRTYVIVSHDRRFLDRTVSGILQLDPETHEAEMWPGTYSEYAEQKLRREQRELAAYKDQQEEVQRIEEDIRRVKDQAGRVESSTNNDVLRRYAKKVAKKAKVRERRLQRKLEDEPRLQKPRKGWNLHLPDLVVNPIPASRMVLEIKDLHAGYGTRRILDGIDLAVRGLDRIALLGENGSGKSTLLRCIAGTLPFEGRLITGVSVRTGMLSQEATELHLERTVLDTFRSHIEMHEGDARTFLHKFLFTGDAVLKPVRDLSYGQRAKLTLAILIASEANFLILDEPTSHLDIPAMEAIEEALASYNGPMIVVSHDRFFLERIGVTRVETLENGRIRSLESLEQYEGEMTHVQWHGMDGSARKGL